MVSLLRAVYPSLSKANDAFLGILTTLKNVKKDVTEMRKGTECGMSFEEWQDMKEGDLVQCYTEVSEKRYL